MGYRSTLSTQEQEGLMKQQWSVTMPPNSTSLFEIGSIAGAEIMYVKW